MSRKLHAPIINSQHARNSDTPFQKHFANRSRKLVLVLARPDRTPRRTRPDVVGTAATYNRRQSTDTRHKKHRKVRRSQTAHYGTATFEQSLSMRQMSTDGLETSAENLPYGLSHCSGSLSRAHVNRSSSNSRLATRPTLAGNLDVQQEGAAAPQGPLGIQPYYY